MAIVTILKELISQFCIVRELKSQERKFARFSKNEKKIRKNSGTNEKINIFSEVFIHKKKNGFSEARGRKKRCKKSFSENKKREN